MGRIALLQRRLSATTRNANPGLHSTSIMPQPPEATTRAWILLCLAFLFPAQYDSKTAPAQKSESTSPTQTPTYTSDGSLLFPADYREWVYLTSGVDMSYSPNAMAMDHSMFDNVFVNPDAYKAFLQAGTWPDKTVLVLEVRVAGSKASPRLI